MTPERWQQLKGLVESALDREPRARGLFLAEACGSDAGLREEAESLVAAYEEDPSFIESPAAQAIPEWSGADRMSAEGENAGPYRLVRKIASGGMGTVFEAVRADDAYQKRVAVKLIRSEAYLDARSRDQLLRRFRMERQTLANLDHPHIARMLDGGSTSSGAPYLVMEFIEGRSIDEYCEARGLDLVGRLNLFRQVCEAVGFAHQNLVIHRDLKPGNILVTGDGAPKLLDFGLAKMLESDSSAMASRLTQSGAQPMTPAYASPEQVRGAPVGTATDIYSLGVILYELLTGVRPFDVHSESPLELARSICEREPVKPSAAVTQSSGAFSTGRLASRPASRLRNGHPERLRRRLAGDLDVIVLRALRKEPEQRYSTVEQFSEDIRRHLEGEPIMARKGTWSYRTGKFVRRHRLGVAFAAALVLFIGVGFALVLWKAEESEKRLRMAESVSNFWMEALRPSDRLESDPFEWSRRRKKSEVTIDQFLSRAAQRVPKLEEPLLEAEMRERLGAICNESARFEFSLPLFEEALVIRRRQQGNDHPDTLLALQNLGYVLLALERWEPARVMLVEAAGGLIATVGRESPATLAARHNLARVLAMLGRMEEAEALFAEVVPAYQRALPADDPRRGQILNNYGVFLLRRGKPVEAEPLLREVLEFRRQTQGKDHADTLNAMLNLASALRLQDRFVEALPLFETAYERGRQVMGEEDVQTLRAGNNYGTCLVQFNRLDEAEALLSTVVEGAMGVWPKGSVDVALFRGSYGECLTRLGRCREALQHLLAAQAFLDKHPPPNAEIPRKSIERLIAAYEACGDTDRAGELRRRLEADARLQKDTTKDGPKAPPGRATGVQS